MKNQLLLLFILVISIQTNAQIGIGTATPKTSLQVVGEPTNTTVSDGIQAPSITLAQLDAKIASYGADQDGAIIYVSDVSVASTKTETAGIIAKGFYYYEFSTNVWKALGASTVVTGMIADGTILSADLANNAIETVKILDGNVTNAKLDKSNIPLSGFGAAAADVALGSNKLTGVADPVSAQDAATKAYVDQSSLQDGTASGDMLYWDGTAWINLTASNYEQASMQIINGVPTWSGGMVPSITIANGSVWMDRNLGASQVASSKTDVASYGDFYQWGRGADGHQLITSLNTSIQTTINSSENKFVTHSSDWLTSKNDNLWQGVNGINNPCPTGFRIPTKAEWDALIATWSGFTKDYAFSSSMKMPLPGRRDQASGGFADTGTNGFYWTSTISGNNAIGYLWVKFKILPIADQLDSRYAV
jgi:uncharacterized protein (TIGR02145 family)